MIIITSLLAFYVAWNLGANDVANSMGTSIGSKAITLRQALIIAGILEFLGAVLFGRNVSKTLATGVVPPSLFAPHPETFAIGMVVVLVACGLWLNLATFWGMPVSSSHAVVGALAGFGTLARGLGAVDWPLIGNISLTWVLTPCVSAAIAALFYSLIRHYLLDPSDRQARLREWIPWLSAALMAAFGVIALPALSQPLQAVLVQHLGWSLPAHDLPLGLGALGAIGLTLANWRQVDRVQASPEKLLARFQVVSACFVAFAHGSNDVGNAVAPLAAFAAIRQTGGIPTQDFQVPLWVMVVGGLGLTAGLAVWGKRVIATIGEGLIPLQPSAGFCAELATATTILLASRLGLPVSTSHALVGGVVGIGLVQGWRNVRWATLRSIVLTWGITIPAAVILSAGLFWLTQWGLSGLVL